MDQSVPSITWPIRTTQIRWSDVTSHLIPGLSELCLSTKQRWEGLYYVEKRRHRVVPTWTVTVFLYAVIVFTAFYDQVQKLPLCPFFSRSNYKIMLVSRTYRSLLRLGTGRAGHPLSRSCSVVSAPRVRSVRSLYRRTRTVSSRRRRPPACTRGPGPLPARGRLAAGLYVPPGPPWRRAAVPFDFQLWTRSRGRHVTGLQPVREATFWSSLTHLFQIYE